MSVHDSFRFGVRTNDQLPPAEHGFSTLDEEEIVVTDSHGNCMEFHSSCFGKTVIVKPHWECLTEVIYDMPVPTYEHKEWAKIFRANRPINHWAMLLKKPKPFAEWFGAHRMRLSSVVTKRFVVVTDGEGGFELGRVEGRFK